MVNTTLSLGSKGIGGMEQGLVIVQDSDSPGLCCWCDRQRLTLWFPMMVAASSHPKWFLAGDRVGQKWVPEPQNHGRNKVPLTQSRYLSVSGKFGEI